MAKHRLSRLIDVPSHYFLKPADVIVERVGDMARAVDRHGNIIAESTDHADVIQSAIDYAYKLVQVGKKRRAIVSGSFEKYTVSKTIYYKSYITLYGFYLKQVDNANLDYILTNDPNESETRAPRLIKIVVDGNAENNTEKNTVGINCSKTNAGGLVYNIVIAYCEVFNTRGHGISPHDVRHGWILYNYVHDNYYDGISLGWNCQDVKIIGNYLYRTGDSSIAVVGYPRHYNIVIAYNIIKETGAVTERGTGGIDIGNTENVIIIGNYIEKNYAYHGIYLHSQTFNGTTYSPKNVVIENNICKDNNANGISVSDSTYVEVIGNKCYGNQLHGIQLYASNHITVIGNICFENVRSGIQLVNSHYNTIVGNRLIRNNQHGIELYDAQHNTVEGNVVSDNSQESLGGYHGIYLGGPNGSKYNVVIGNISVSWGAYQGYGIYEDTTSDYNIINNNRTTPNRTGEVKISGSHSQANAIIYTSLPTDGFVIKGEPITYYDGTTYYLVIWDGSTWRKVALS